MAVPNSALTSRLGVLMMLYTVPGSPLIRYFCPASPRKCGSPPRDEGPLSSTNGVRWQILVVSSAAPPPIGTMLLADGGVQSDPDVRQDPTCVTSSYCSVGS
eukprot:TRINITY_DN577_c0_g2_i4.p2 TRINITY_DN577_c0_g2~~TRINITY_DN577_c0_g2_i4.p2  ORF type:complete len:102 (-),score=10.75 TRINITY_DN577_c0_g2_i4:357-662(-)